MEKLEFEKLSDRAAELEMQRHTTQLKIGNLRRGDPAIQDFDATKATLEKTLTAITQELTTTRAKIEAAHPLMVEQATRLKVASVPKILLSVMLSGQMKELNDDLSFSHTFKPCGHTAKLNVFDLLPASRIHDWNAIIDSLADYSGSAACPECRRENRSILEKFREAIAKFRKTLPPNAEIQETGAPTKQVSTTSWNLHIKK